MKNWDLTINALGSRTFIATIHIVATMVSWKCSGKKGWGKFNLAPNLLLNWISCPVEI
jgi:hypothetical protein